MIYRLVAPPPLRRLLPRQRCNSSRLLRLRAMWKISAKTTMTTKRLGLSLLRLHPRARTLRRQLLEHQ